MRKKTLWAGGAVVILIILRLTTSPVVLTAPFFREHNGEPQYVLLNPLRNRIPEEVANQALLSIKSGRCDEALKSALDMNQDDKAYVCEMFGDWGLADWELRNRTDSSNVCKLYFWHHGTEGVWVTLRRAKGEWKLSYLNVIY